jgi:hypothetical protein
MRRLVGIDLTAHAERHTIVPEGVDLATIDHAIAEASAHARGAEPGPALRSSCETWSARCARPSRPAPDRERRTPAPVKGMATLVEAWAREPLSRRANLLVIGGDVDRPSLDEREQLDLIEGIVPQAERARAGLLLPGHRANDVAARWIARRSVRAARPDRVRRGLRLRQHQGGVRDRAARGMATGLFVVAPDGGGPAPTSRTA